MLVVLPTVLVDEDVSITGRRGVLVPAESGDENAGDSSAWTLGRDTRGFQGES